MLEQYLLVIERLLHDAMLLAGAAVMFSALVAFLSLLLWRLMETLFNAVCWLVHKIRRKLAKA